jgi:hypothetical protein
MQSKQGSRPFARSGALPCAVGTQIAQLNRQAELVQRFYWEQQNPLSAGVCYELPSKLDLKAHTDHIAFRDSAALINTAPILLTDREFWVPRFALDFTF